MSAAACCGGPGVQRRLQACRDAPLVDYAEVTALKLPVLEVMFQQFEERASDDRKAAFAAFRKEQGEPLERLCRFLALRRHFAPDKADWRTWPKEYRDPDSSAVERFAREHTHEVDFMAWAQWIADEQLGKPRRGEVQGDAGRALPRSGGRRRQQRSRDLGEPKLVIGTAHVGAPPDLYDPAGQDWGLPPFNPWPCGTKPMPASSIWCGPICVMPGA